LRLYSAAPTSSIRMSDDPQLRQLLRDTSKRNAIIYILETGTNIGLGSTKFIAETLGNQSPTPKHFVTIEANHHSWRRARRNLRAFPFVTTLWGLSTIRDEAIRFISDDPVLRNHPSYPDIFIDDVKDPVAFYSREVDGHLGGGSRNPIKKVLEVADRQRYYAGEDLLAKWLHAFKSFDPLIVLDSAGGIGYLEFITVLRVMEGHPYLLLLDDICHLKHFRSYDYICNERRFAVLGERKESGWLLARYCPVTP